MALHSMTQSLQQLTLACTRHTVRGSATPIPMHYQLYNFASSVILNGNRSGLHTTAVTLRNLDSHKVKPSKLPSSRTGRWVPKKKMSELYPVYTIKPLPFPRTGGRGPNGRIWTHRIGGGFKREFRMIDWVRGGPEEGKPMQERVEEILDDDMRSGKLALVAGGERKRYIIATQNMKVGDLINSSRALSKTAVRAAEGDSYPLGSLPVGTLVNCVELFPGAGALRARAAGVTAVLVRKTEDQCVVRLPSKREMCVSNKCVATVGRVSNEDHNKVKLGKAGASRWLGIRPKSGRWHRKDGYCGRKIRPIKPMQVYSKPRKPQVPVYQMSIS